MSDPVVIGAAVTTARGPDGATPPVRIVAMSPLAIIGVRTLRTYLQSVLGLFIAANVGQAAGASPGLVGMSMLSALELAAVASLAPALVALLQNGVELLSSLDATNPKLRG